MNSNIRHLITSGRRIELAHLEIHGEPKGQGHGEITLEDQKITLTMIGNRAARVKLAKDLKIKAETRDGEILLITGRPHEIENGHYPKIAMHVNEVMGRRSAREPD